MISKGFKVMWLRILIGVLFIGLLVIGFQYMQAQRTQLIIHYLVNDKNYTESDIADIKTIGPHIATPLSTIVVFKDEPNAQYWYKVEEDRIIQYNQVPAIYDYKQKYIHSESNES